MLRLSLVFCLLAGTVALETVPHASGIKAVGTNVRRAPAAKPATGLSLVPHAHRMSTGVRRAPNEPVAAPLATARPQKLVRPGVPAVTRPALQMPIPMIPLFPQLPLLQQHQLLHPQTIQHQPLLQPIPTLSPVALPTATFAPFTLPTMSTLFPMPTMPSMTMPPSFQRLLGMTTTPAPAPVQERRSYREEKTFDDERAIKTKKPRGLSSVSSRLPKFVDNEEEVVTPEKNADWIVPF